MMLLVDVVNMKAAERLASVSLLAKVPIMNLFYWNKTSWMDTCS